MRSPKDLGAGILAQIRRVLVHSAQVARRYSRIAFALALIVGPLVVGVSVLSQDSPQRVEPASLGFVPPESARRGRGFTLGLAVRFDTCDKPLDVTAVATGTAEYWIDNAEKLRGPARFMLALPNVSGEVEVRTGTSASDVADPDTTRLRSGDPRLVGPDSFRVDPPRRQGDLTIVAGTIRNWPATLAPLVADFDADWIEKRGIGTCFIHLPAIAGDYSILSAQRALGRARPVNRLIVNPNDLTVDSRALKLAARYDPALEVAYGSAIVRVDNGSIDSDESLPAPTQSVNGNPTWTCAGRARSTMTLTDAPSEGNLATDDYVLLGSDPLGSAGALSTAALRLGPAGDCSAVVAASEASAQWKRDLVLLLIGALVSLGVTIIVEFALGLGGRPAKAEAS
jgi:hypothetical protein